MSKEKLFTPAEANKTLPLVRMIVADILARGRELRALAEASEKGDDSADERSREIGEELESLNRELEEIGCTFRDYRYEMGLVDYPAVIDGRPVLLCWRSDEPEIGFYHAIEAGYAGRQPIPKGLLGASSSR